MFTDLALRKAKPGGIIAFVTPTSFLAGEYFKNLRGLLAREAPPASIDFIALRKGVFENVLQETLLATYRRGAPRTNVNVYEISPSNGEELNIEIAGNIELPSIRPAMVTSTTVDTGSARKPIGESAASPCRLGV